MSSVVKNEIECLNEAWDALDEIVQTCTTEQLTTLGRDRWTIKDHLAHITYAEQFVIASLMGEPVDKALSTDRNTVLTASDDELNQVGYELYKALSEEQVLAMRERVHQELMGGLARLGDDDLLKPFAPFGEPLGGTLLDVLRKNTYEHYDTHRVWLEEIVNLETRGE